MENKRLANTEAEFLLGYVKGEDTILIHDNPVQISAFILKYHMQNVIITDVFDQQLIATSMGFLMSCSNQEYLAKYLLPVLVPMQRGEKEIPNFEPYVIKIELIKQLINNPTLERAEDIQLKLEDYEYEEEMLRLNPVIVALEEGKEKEALSLLNQLLADVQRGERLQ
ncbi:MULTISPECIES: hypothetical protein [Pseudobacillus]|uniref:hypothetical protein n=1 Tax=Pseudobacillus TaxID=108525 RepID=UPI003879F5B6